MTNAEEEEYSPKSWPEVTKMGSALEAVRNELHTQGKNLSPAEWIELLEAIREEQDTK